MPTSPCYASKTCFVMLAHLVEDNMLTPYSNPFECLSFEPQHPIILHPLGYPCLIVAKGDFVPKGAK